MEPRVTADVSKVAWDLDLVEAKDRMVSDLFEDLKENLESYRGNPRDDEAVHEIRVDVRKLISMLYFFKPLVAERKEQTLKKGLKEVLQSFGSIREGDMLAKSLREFMEKEPGFLKPAEALISELAKRRTEDVAKSLEGINSQETHDRVRNLEAELQDGNLLESAGAARGKEKRKPGTVKVEDYAEERFIQILERLKVLAEEDDFKDIEKVHAYRIRCKKASYSLMLAETVTTLDTKAWVRRLKDIQDVTGNIHDAQVNKVLLQEMKVDDRAFEGAYLAFLASIIRKRLDEFEGQLEDVRKSGINLRRED